jgi:hypothetical protein
VTLLAPPPSSRSPLQEADARLGLRDALASGALGELLAIPPASWPDLWRACRAVHASAGVLEVRGGSVCVCDVVCTLCVSVTQA